MLLPVEEWVEGAVATLMVQDCVSVGVCLHYAPMFHFHVLCLWVIGSLEPQTVDTGGFWCQPLRRR